MFRFRPSRCLLVACLRYTQGTTFSARKEESDEDGCCASCHGTRSNVPRWTEQFAMASFNTAIPPYRLSLNEDVAVTAGRNDKQTTEDTPTADEQNAPTSPCKNGRLKRFDWREHGAVTGVRSQKECGCCFAIASGGSIEGLGKITTGTLEQFSVQQLIDCDLKGRNDGCYGGYASTTFQYVMEFGITTERLYPFTSHKNFREKRKYEDVHKRYRRCKKVDPRSLSYISGFKYVDNDGDALEAALLINPVVVTIVADKNFSMYRGGIITPWECPPPTKDRAQDSNTEKHHLLLVGFDETDYGVRYWVAKNSWGEWWGEDGYCRIQRDTCVHPWGVAGIMAWRGLSLYTVKQSAESSICVPFLIQSRMSCTCRKHSVIFILHFSHCSSYAVNWSLIVQPYGQIIILMLNALCLPTFLIASFLKQRRLPRQAESTFVMI